MPVRQRDGHHHGANQQREPRAIDKAREDVAADRVGAEQVFRFAACLPYRGQQKRGLVLDVGSMRRKQRRENRHNNQQDEDEEADDRA